MAANKNIFIKIEVSSKEAKKNVDDVEKGVNKLTAAQKRLAFEQSQEAKELAKLNAQIKKHRDANKLAAESADDLSNSTKRAKTQVGLNNAILTEAGRAASDLRFGFNGVANNVGQLASLFGNLINTSDNVLTSLKNLAKSFMGTGGILIVIQLLIAYGDQIYDFFFSASSGAEELKKKMESLTKPIEENRLELLGYIEVLKDATSSEEARKVALDELQKILPDVTFSQEELTSAVEDYIHQQLIRAEIDAVISLNSETFARKRKMMIIESIQDEEEKTKKMKEFLDDEQEFFAASGRTRAEQRKFDRLSEEEQNKIRFKELKERTDEEADLVLSSVTELQKQLKEERKESPLFEPDLMMRFDKGEWKETEKLVLKETIEFVDDVDEAAGIYALGKGEESLLSKIFKLSPKTREAELQKLKEDTEKFGEEALLGTIAYRDAVQAVNDKYDLAERKAKVKHLQTMLGGLSDFLKSAADIADGNKDIARASIIASAAASSVGVWEAWLVKDPTFSPAPLKVAGAIATQLAIVASTVSALKSLDSNTPIGSGGAGGGATIQAPDFNVVGASGTNQLAQAVGGQVNQPIRAFVVGSDVTNQQELDRRIVDTAGIG